MTGFKTIDDTIESVVRQECSECEILILRNDIQSLPQGTDVAEKNVSYMDSDYLLREIFIREKGKGNALNEGILRAKNNLVCVLDADCILKENALSQAVRHFESDFLLWRFLHYSFHLTLYVLILTTLTNPLPERLRLRSLFKG